jgi:hypothetical protein
MKRAVFLLISFALFASMGGNAIAGSKHRHRLEGLAIGIGSMLLVDAIHNQFLPSERFIGVPPSRPCGHWEIRRHWVPPEFRRVWCEGHYDRHHRWIPGYWTRVKVRDGYYRRARVWVECR